MRAGYSLPRLHGVSRANGATNDICAITAEWDVHGNTQSQQPKRVWLKEGSAIALVLRHAHQQKQTQGVDLPNAPILVVRLLMDH